MMHFEKGSFECTICCETIELDAAHAIDDSPICRDCLQDVIDMFKKAVKHEHAYPPRWGNIDLDVADFEYLLGADFVQRYRRKEVEYKAPVEDRIYCKHRIPIDQAPEPGASCPKGKVLAKTLYAEKNGHLVPHADPFGPKLFRDKKLEECGGCVSVRPQRKKGQPLVCYRCHGDVCGRCREPVASDEIGKSFAHECRVHTEPETDPYESMEKGKDYQICPGCKTSIELRDGCNAIHCECCRTDFCFLCGEVAGHDSKHWLAGESKCPRFGRPDAARPIFDRVAPQAAPAAAGPVPNGPQNGNDAQEPGAPFLAIHFARMLLVNIGNAGVMAGLQGDEDGVARENVRHFRQLVGERIWADVLVQVVAIQEEIERQRAADREQRVAAGERIEDIEMEDAIEDAPQPAQQPPPGPIPDAIRQFPDQVTAQHEVLDRNHLVFDVQGNPVNADGHELIHRHIDMVNAIRATGEATFAAQFPFLVALWRSYTNRLPLHLVNEMQRRAGMWPNLPGVEALLGGAL